METRVSPCSVSRRHRPQRLRDCSARCHQAGKGWLLHVLSVELHIAHSLLLLSNARFRIVLYSSAGIIKHSWPISPSSRPPRCVGDRRMKASSSTVARRYLTGEEPQPSQVNNAAVEGAHQLAQFIAQAILPCASEHHRAVKHHWARKR